MIQRCPTPVLAAPRMATDLSRALLAYDGSPKAQEAAFVSTYLAVQWDITLVVVTVSEGARTTAKTLDRARGLVASHSATSSSRQA